MKGFSFRKLQKNIVTSTRYDKIYDTHLESQGFPLAFKIDTHLVVSFKFIYIYFFVLNLMKYLQTLDNKKITDRTV